MALGAIRRSWRCALLNAQRRGWFQAAIRRAAIYALRRTPNSLAVVSGPVRFAINVACKQSTLSVFLFAGHLSTNQKEAN